jgi:predicted Rossmann-fold nucleotide-binding protein
MMIEKRSRSCFGTHVPLSIGRGAMPSKPTDLHQNGSGVVRLSDEREVELILQSSVLGLWEIVNSLTRIRPRPNGHYRVTIFGSARCEPGSLPYEETRRAAEALAEMGCDIITGGGPGLMQAANEGAIAAGSPERDRSVGIRVDLPFEQGMNAFVRMAFTHRTFFTRLHHFVLSSDAYIVAPGGIGTLLEMTMIWQLLQVRHLEDVPLILVGPMWPELIAWADKNMVHGLFPMARDSDMKLPTCVATADEGITLIRAHREAWLRNNRDASEHPADTSPKPS